MQVPARTDAIAQDDLRAHAPRLKSEAFATNPYSLLCDASKGYQSPRMRVAMSTPSSTHAAACPAHVLITGASSGLGAELAFGFAARGHALTLMGRNADRLRAVAERCREVGAAATVVCCDVRDAVTMQEALCQADDRLPFSTVIANSGIGGSEVMIREGYEPPDLARRIVDVNLIGVINTIAPLQQAFIARRRGTFVMVSSMAAFEGLADAPTYAATKAAVRIYGHGLRRLLAPHGVRVSVVTPGFVSTPMSASLPLSPPFLWTAERAARRIFSGLDRNEPEIAFPWQMKVGLALARVLPVRVVDLALRGLQAHAEQRR